MNKKLMAVMLCAFFSVFGEAADQESKSLYSAITSFESLVKELAVATVEDFLKHITQIGIVVVKFGSSSCSICREYMPIFNEVAQENPYITVGNKTEKVTYIHTDVDLFSALSDAMQIQFLPTTFFFKNGERRGMIIGMQTKEVLIKNITALVL